MKSNEATAQKETTSQKAQNALVVPSEKVKSLLASPAIKARFEEVLGKRAPAFISSIISAVSTNKMLSECDPKSIIGSAAVAAAMDLPISPGLGMAHIVPYNTKEDGKVAQFQIGWKGFVQLAMRSAQYKTINATPVLEGQIKALNQFTGEIEFNQRATSNKQIGYLLYFKLLNGYEKYFYMSREACDAHGKRYSKSYKKGYGLWVDDFEAMALKTVVKMGLSKYGLLSVEMQRAVETDQAVLSEDGEIKYVDNEPRDITPAPEAPTGVASLNDKIKQAKSSKTEQAETPPVEEAQLVEEEEHI